MTPLALVAPAGTPVDRGRYVESRTELAALLRGRLADAIALQRHCRDAHFFARGLDVASLHKLLIDIYWAADSYARAFGARLVHLDGGRPDALRTMPARPPDRGDGIASTDDEDYTESLRAALGAFEVQVRVTNCRAEELGDSVSAELCGGIADSVDRWLSVLQYHLWASV